MVSYIILRLTAKRRVEFCTLHRHTVPHFKTTQASFTPISGLAPNFPNLLDFDISRGQQGKAHETCAKIIEEIHEYH